MSAPKRCLLCGQVVPVRRTGRVCRKCRKPLERYHKFRHLTTDEPGVYTLEHWDCDDPTGYGRKHE